jgi:hypothetical protein
MARLDCEAEMKTHYEQVPLELVKKITEAERDPEKKHQRPRREKKKALKQAHWGLSALRVRGAIS